MVLLETPIPEEEIKILYEGIFDFEAVYKAFYKWLGENAFKKIQEKKYKDKTGDPLGNNIEVEITAEKEMDPVVKGSVVLKLAVEEGNWTEHRQNGESKKMIQGKLTAKISGKIIWDPKSWFAPGKKSGAVSGIVRDLISNSYVALKKKEFEHNFAVPFEDDCIGLSRKIKTILNTFDS
ncbi:MAG: hypothetical protein V1659_03215 [Candidatus Woesearchaeota archaeon]